MDLLLVVLRYTLWTILAILPFFIFLLIRKLEMKKSFINYLVLAILITPFLIFAYAWISNFSNEILLVHYGYNFEAMNHIERFEKVNPKSLDKVKTIEKSLMGLGWLLKAIMLYPIYFLYILIVFPIVSIFKSKAPTIDHEKKSKK